MLGWESPHSEFFGDPIIGLFNLHEFAGDNSRSPQFSIPWHLLGDRLIPLAPFEFSGILHVINPLKV